jgi:peptidyl-prolyl cis-trans isomerase SurA
VEVSHILVRGADDEAKNLISKVYDELQKNGNWDTLCAKYSQDQGTRESGGRLRPFGLGALASAPKFEEVAFSLNEVGVISEPVQTSFGWHIIRLERKIPLPPFAELKTSLERRIARDERMAISKTLVAEKRKSKFNYKANGSMTKNLKLLADSSIVKGNWKLSKTVVKETEILFSIGETNFTVREFANYITGNQSGSNVSPNSYIQELYDQFVDEQLAAMEDTQLQNANPEYRKMVKEYREGILLFSIMEKEVWNKASEDSLGQRKYYNEHADKYASGLRLEARIFSTEDQSFRDEIKGKIQKGDTLSQGDTKKFKSILNFRAYERGDNKIIDLINWTVGLHEAENEGMYYLVEASKLVSPGLKKFSEVRASVISDYQDYLEKAWLKDLKEKYPAKVNSKGRKKAIEELTSKSKS